MTGVFYERNDPAALAEAVLGFDALGVDPAACVRAAERFGVDRFQDRLAGIVADARRRTSAPPRPDERPALAGRAASRPPLEQAERAEARRRRVAAREVVVEQPHAARAPGGVRARGAAVTGSVSRTTTRVRVRSRSATISRCTGAEVTTPGAAMS